MIWQELNKVGLRYIRAETIIKLETENYDDIGHT